MSSVKTKPKQKTDFVVRQSATDSSKAVYRGNNAQEARNVAKNHKNATITFRTDDAVASYLSVR
jgi:hypothetical protein